MEIHGINMMVTPVGRAAIGHRYGVAPHIAQLAVLPSRLGQTGPAADIGVYRGTGYRNAPRRIAEQDTRIVEQKARLSEQVSLSTTVRMQPETQQPSPFTPSAMVAIHPNPWVAMGLPTATVCRPFKLRRAALHFGGAPSARFATCFMKLDSAGMVQWSTYSGRWSGAGIGDLDIDIDGGVLATLGTSMFKFESATGTEQWAVGGATYFIMPYWAEIYTSLWLLHVDTSSNAVYIGGSTINDLPNPANSRDATTADGCVLKFVFDRSVDCP